MDLHRGKSTEVNPKDWINPMIFSLSFALKKSFHLWQIIIAFCAFQHLKLKRLQFLFQAPQFLEALFRFLKPNKFLSKISREHTCGDGGSLYKNESELLFFPLSNKAERLCDYHHTSSFLLFFPSLLHYSGVCMEHCPSWVSQSPKGVS